MSQKAVVTSGGKQYLVSENDEIVVQKLDGKANESISLDVLALLNTEKNTIQLGAPALSKKVSATIVEQGKGEKVRVAKFRAKVRYRKVTGFRPQLTKIKIGKFAS
jgi:large subunit ribosomal protein L21